MKCDNYKRNPNCKKVIEGKANYIWRNGKCLRVCESCFNKIKWENKEDG